MSRSDARYNQQSPLATLRTLIEQMAARGTSAPDIARCLGCDLKYAYQITNHVTSAGRGDDSMPDEIRDLDHVNAVLGEGSYPVVYSLDGKAYWINVWGRPWGHHSIDGSRRVA